MEDHVQIIDFCYTWIPRLAHVHPNFILLDSAKHGFTIQGQRNICGRADWYAPDFKTMLYDQFMIYKMVHFEQQGV